MCIYEYEDQAGAEIKKKRNKMVHSEFYQPEERVLVVHLQLHFTLSLCACVRARMRACVCEHVWHREPLTPPRRQVTLL